MIEERIVNHVTLHPHWLGIGLVFALRQFVETVKLFAEFWWNWQDRKNGKTII